MQRAKTKHSLNKPTHTGSGFVRIIAGKWRGRKLPVKNVEGLRPTTDRVKETLFNWLQFDIVQARCLDLFAGSGSLGLEALSRNAAKVTFIEKDKSAHAQLAKNLSELNVDNATLQHCDAFDFLAQNKNQANTFDLVFIDPPFHQDLLENICDQLNKNSMIEKNGLIYIESELPFFNLPSTWVPIKEKKAGQVYFRLYRKEE